MSRGKSYIDQTNAAHRSRHVCATFFTAMVVFALGACQPDGPPALSLAEAKKVTATFAGHSFVPPPKTITDVTAILDSQKRENVAVEGRQTAQADSEPPPGADRDALARFYYGRGKTARKIGRLPQALADLTKANELSSGWIGKEKSDVLFWLGMTERSIGNRRDASRHLDEAYRVEKRSVRLVNMASTISRVRVSMGDLDGGKLYLAKARREMEDIRNGADRRSTRIWARWQDRMLQSVEGAEATLLERSGKFAEAESLHRSAIDRFLRARRNLGADFRVPPRMLDFLRGNLGRNLQRQGRLIEAEIEIRAALLSALKRSGRYTSLVASLTRHLAGVMGAQGRPRDAEALARAAIEIIEKTGASANSGLMLSSRLRLARAYSAQSRWREALEQFELIKSALGKEDKLASSAVLNNSLYAMALLRKKRHEEALPVARGAFEHFRARMGVKHANTALARATLAIALMANGQDEAALEAFRGAIPILLQRSRRSGGENSTQTGRDRRIARTLEAYIRLLSRIRGTATERTAAIDAAAEAFQMAEIVRGQSVQSALAASAARAAARDPDLADLARREQDAVKQISALNGLLADAVSVPLDQQDSKAGEALRARIDSLRAARAALAEEIGRRFPDYTALINPPAATIPQVRAMLRPHEALIATFVSADKTYIWALAKTGKAAFAAVPMGRDRLASAVRRLRLALDPKASTLGEIPQFDVRLAARLYQALLAPLEAGWKDARSLLVVGHRALGQLPFSALVTTSDTGLLAEKKPLFSNYRSVPWLARTHAVTVLPSVSSLALLRNLPPAAATRRAFVGFGDPWFSMAQATSAVQAKPIKTATLTSRGITVRGLKVHLRAVPNLEGVSTADLANLPRLPDTADEVKGIALALNANLSRDVFTGREAGEDRVRSMTLSGYKVLAFATHGLVPGDLNGLTQPALALSAPAVTGGREDGLLTMGEILELKLDADWVVLSACNTASGNGAGAEAISGLGRAFFYAGTRALLVSNWPVETTSARALTTDIFKRQAKDPSLSRAQALQKSMLGLIDGSGFKDGKGKTVFSYAHPIFWAPFSLVGDGGGGKPTS